MSRKRIASHRAHERDVWVRRARQEGYRSRAAYKLAAIDRAQQLFRPGQKVIDLGAAPGGWSQYARGRIGNGRVVAVDLLPMTPIAGVDFVQGDFTDPAVVEAVRARAGGGEVDLVICDMAPNISGIAARDQARAAALAQAALAFARQVLKPRGVVVVKAFEGEDAAGIRDCCRAWFGQVATAKPEASKSRSAEFYLVARDPRPGPDGDAPAAGAG